MRNRSSILGVPYIQQMIRCVSIRIHIMSQMWSDTHLHGINRGVIEIGAGYSGRITGHVLQPGRDIRLFLTAAQKILHWPS